MSHGFTSFLRIYRAAAKRHLPVLLATATPLANSPYQAGPNLVYFWRRIEHADGNAVWISPNVPTGSNDLLHAALEIIEFTNRHPAVAEFGDMGGSFRSSGPAHDNRRMRFLCRLRPDSTFFEFYVGARVTRLVLSPYFFH